MFDCRLQLYLIAALAVLFFSATTQARPHDLGQATTKPTVLIVNGASHTPKHFEPLQALLEESGYSVYNPRLPSNALLPPDNSHQQDVETIRDIVEELASEGKRIIVLMHSYGGFVGTNALADLGLEQRREKGLNGGVEWLAYMAALLPTAGETVGELLQGASGSSLTRRGAEAPPVRNETARALLPPLNPELVFYGDLTPEAQQWAVAELTGVSRGAFTQKSKNEAWRNIKVAYLTCEEDKAVPIALQHRMIDRIVDQGIDVQENNIVSSHSPYLSQPHTVVNWLEKLRG